MGRYICVSLRFEKGPEGLRVFEPLFASEHFRPIGLGGIGSSKTAPNRWLLAGYGLESFVSQFSWTKRGGPPSFTLVPSPYPDHGGYLQQFVDLIKVRKNPTRQLSLHEYAVQEVGTTFIDAPFLESSVLKDGSHWMTSSQSSYFKILGTFSIATWASEQHDWQKAFRFLVEEPTDYMSVGIPFVWFSFNPQVRELNVFSESTIWAKKVSSLNGLVSGEKADENLRRLGDLTNLLGTGGFEGLTREVSFKGSVFRNELERIEEMLA